ncbi:hypothetical protein PV325_003521 [Microctonus aethiopoides]|nr:hypothetical protein PV325_003521 [Microctonus aethiopoides]
MERETKNGGSTAKSLNEYIASQTGLTKSSRGGTQNLLAPTSRNSTIVEIVVVVVNKHIGVPSSTPVLNAASVGGGGVVGTTTSRSSSSSNVGGILLAPSNHALVRSGGGLVAVIDSDSHWLTRSSRHFE